MDENQKNTCEHCSKEDCAQCISKDGKNFCCENCCKDYEERQAKPKQEPVNVCKFC